ncbi:ent-kaurene oxidase, chloroplastic-like [Papaver somniferum]|uniref:ent-kaurene oxidase, chloroplastic-like n=1 Tax=Papaver somniferum TaxID=3469 RepID=UPI000E6FFF04|nr:ent-kaurene oxidase, chloroplastic-like [Papaver somniferum]
MGLFMESFNKSNQPKHFLVIPLVITLVIGFVSMITIRKFYLTKRTTVNTNLQTRTYSSPPVVPGLPLIGNLLQLKDKILQHVFANWAEIHGPIYSIKAGATTIVVLNSTDVAKEAMVTKFSSISKQKHTYAMKILTPNSITTSDSNEYHKMARRHLVTHMLGSSAQRRHRAHRDIVIDNVVHRLHAHANENPLDQLPVNFKRILQTEMFGLSLKQAFGKDIESSKYIEGLGETLSRDEIHRVLVLDPLSGAAEMDWGDFLPYMRWVPSNSFKMHIGRIETRRLEVMKTLIEEQLIRISSGEGINCFLDRLLSEGKTLTKTQLTKLVWETLVGSETTVATVEWALYELAKNLKHQDRLYLELQKACGNNKFTEEQYSEVTYLSAVFHETLRRYPPFPLVLPLRYVHEDTQLGGYDILAGSQIALNIYGCNMDKKQWDSPEEWNPERFLDIKYDPMDIYKTMSFGGGKRVCPGSSQGLSIACTAIARCIQEFKWSLKPGRREEDINHTTQKLNPLVTTLTPRDY